MADEFAEIELEHRPKTVVSEEISQVVFFEGKARRMRQARSRGEPVDMPSNAAPHNRFELQELQMAPPDGAGFDDAVPDEIADDILAVEAEEAERAAVPHGESSIEGFVDGLDARWHVVGWAREANLAEYRLTIEIREGGRLLTSDLAAHFRGDLLEARPGDGKYGFKLAIPDSLFDGKRHSLEVRAASTTEMVVLGQMNIVLPSRMPKSVGQKGAARASAAELVQSVLGDGKTQSANYLERYIQQLVPALEAVAREYDIATALGLLYVHILHRRIDEGGLQSRLLRVSQNPEQLSDVIREVVNSDEAQQRIKKPSGYHLPDPELVWTWTRVRPVA